MFRILMISTGSNLLVMFVKLLLTFIMTPILIRSLGNYDYGIWEMVSAVVGYMGVLNLGINPAVSRFAAKYRAEQDPENLCRIYAAAFVFLAAIGLIVALVMAGWGLFFNETMAPEDGRDPAVYTIFMLILAVQLLIVFPGHVAESFLEGFQKYYVKNNITIVNSLVGAALFIAFANPENALLLLAGINAIGLSVKYLLYMGLLAKPAYGAIKFNKSSFRLSKLKELLKFSSKSFVQGTSTVVENTTDTLIIGAFLGPAVVPLYSIPLNLTRYIRTLGWTLSHAFMPMFSDLSARQKSDDIRSLYLVASKVVAGLVAAMGLGMLGIGTPFLTVWIGPEYTEHSDAIILLLVLFTVLPMMNPFSSRYLTAIDRHGIFAKLMPISAGTNLLLSLILVHVYGILGVAVASVIPVFFIQPLVLIHCCKHLEIPVRRYLLESIIPLFVPISGMSVVLAYARYVVGINSYFSLIVTVTVAASVYLIMFWYFSFKASEREFVRDKVHRRLLARRSQ